MVRCLHTADLHLGASFPSFGPVGAKREEDFILTFRRLIDLAIQREVQLFLVAGDLFDYPDPEPSLVGTVEGEFQRLVKRGILPVLLPGTHDHLVGGDSIYQPGRFQGCLQLLGEEGPVRADVDGTSVYLYGCNWRGAQEVDLAGTMRRKADDGFHVGLLHGSLQGSPEWDYRSKDFPFTFPALKQWNLDYVALGHYHRYQKLEDKERLWAAYPGSPEGKRFGENGPRFALIVDLEPGKTTVEAVGVQSRQLLEYDLELDAQMTDLQIAEAITSHASERSLVRFHLAGVMDRALPLDYLKAYAGNRFDYLDLVDGTRWLEGDFVTAIAEEETVRGDCVRRFQALLAAADGDEARLEIEQAFREVMVRFQGKGLGA